MQFLLTAVNAKYIHSNPAIYSLWAYAGAKLQPFIGLAEYTINHRVDEILGDLYLRNPDVIGFSCYIWNYALICEVLKEIPKVLPCTDIWLGGPEVSFEANEILAKFPMVTGIMAGEGEEAFRDLLLYYLDKKGVEAETAGECKYTCLHEIPGLILPDGATLARNLPEINNLPFPYKEISQFEKFDNRIIYYETSRGCPFRCSYCLSSIDKQVRLRDLGKVKRELQFFLDKKVPQVKLTDRTFNCNSAHAMEIWKYIIENDNGVTNFHFEIAADIMREEELNLLKQMRPGLIQLEIGVQSTNQRTLKEINRITNLTHIAKVAERIRCFHNIHIHLDLIAGLPFEDFDSFKKSFDDVYAMKPHQLQLGFLKVLKGTGIWERADDYGIVYQSRPPYEVLSTKWISYGEILKLKQIEEMVELYYNSNQFTHILPVLEKSFEGAFEMFWQLASFYEEKGYFTNSPARSYRYQVLLDFVLCKVPEKEELFRELFTFDYYLRENAKSRPAFGTDLSLYRESIWNFYQKEEKKPEFLQEYRGCHARQAMKMTHMDVFYYPVWEKDVEQLQRRKEAPAFVLFDYKKRDALTGEAAALVVSG